MGKEREVVPCRSGSFTEGKARTIGERIGIDWSAGDVDLEQFRMGLTVELDHGSHDPDTDVTHDDEVLTGKIVLAHLREIVRRGGRGRALAAGRGP
jgi:Protein of unknown function (DUF5661)